MDGLTPSGARIQNKKPTDTRIKPRIGRFNASASNVIKAGKHIPGFSGQTTSERRRIFCGLAGQEETGYRQFVNL